MDEVSELMSDLTARHGEKALSVRWGRVLEACDDAAQRRLCLQLCRNKQIRLDGALKTLRAVNVYAIMPPSAQAQVRDAIGRAIVQDGSERPALPTSWDALRAWVDEQGLMDFVEGCPLRFVPGMDAELAQLDLSPTMSPYLNLSLLLSAPPRGGLKPLRTPWTLRLVSEFLQGEARRRAEEGPRRARWERPVKGEGMAELADALRRLHDSLSVRTRRAFAPSDASLSVDEPTLTLEASVRGSYGTTADIDISIVRREPDGRPVVDSTSAIYAPHVYSAVDAVVALWRDVVHDPEHPLNPRVAALANRPRWEGLLADLSARLDARAPSRPAKPERVVWRIHGDGVEITVEPAIQRLGKRGWSKGKRSTPEEIHDRNPLDPLDLRVIVGHHGKAGDLIESLVGHPRVILADEPERGVTVVERSVSVELGDETPRRFYLRVGAARLDASTAFSRLARPRHYVWLDRETATLTVAQIPEQVITLLAIANEWNVGLPPEADDVVLELLTRLPGEVGLRLPAALAGTTVEADSTPRFGLELHQSGALEVRVQLSPLGDAKRFRPGAGPIHLSGERDGARVSTSRDVAAELREAERGIDTLGLGQAREMERFRFVFEDVAAALDFLGAADAHAARLEWISERRLRVRGTVGHLSVSTRESRDWFVLDAEAEVDEQLVTLAAMRRAVDRGERYVKLGRGEFARIEESLVAQLAQLSNVSSERGGEVVVRKEAAPSVERILADSAQSSLQISKAWEAQLKRIREANEATPRKPRSLKAKLRDYQTEGVRWLLRLSLWSGGCCLADEMGLGKTVQALALLTSRAKGGPTLVVAPTSLAYNWRDEAARFAPQLDVHIYRGADRASLLDRVGPRTLLVTSYDLMARDADALSAIRWETVVFDEAHALKNPKTQRSEAARRLEAGFRLALTGTPVENHLGELWALFDVIVPGLLGDAARFRQRFATPIQIERDRGQEAALRAIVSPFLLRRTKAQVAKELPPRTEVVRAVELSPEEMARYELERREALASLAATATDPSSRFAMLAALTRLRRLACHPALVDESAPPRSTKLDAALELLDELREGDHRALVFSQFTSHLALLRRELDRRGARYLYLDGATPAAERAKLVKRFQSSDVPYFLISLKAGGTGLNLTGADTVVHLDPWWNPAVEDQASDRAHRIGQDKPVTVIRLIAQGTIEDKVLALHAEKRELAEGLLEGSEANARLDTAALIALLAEG